MNYNDGLGWVLMNLIGPAILAVALAWGAWQSYQWRRRRGRPLDARAVGHGGEPTGRILAALGLPVLATFVLIAIVVMTHLGPQG